MGAADGPAAGIVAQAIRAPGNLAVHDGARLRFHCRRRHRPAGRHPLHDQGRPARRPARSRAQARRSLHGRHACGSSKARSPTCSRSCSARPPTACRRAGRACNGGCAISDRRLQQFNLPTRARRNVAHHYDLDGRLYSLFLDADRQYSCAYFEHPEQSLDDAQLAKKRHLAAKLLLEGRTSACSTSAAAGAGLRSISPNSAAPASPASRCRTSNGSAPASAPPKRT